MNKEEMSWDTVRLWWCVTLYGPDDNHHTWENFLLSLHLPKGLQKEKDLGFWVSSLDR
jgi:hypothetical protein